MQEALDQIMQSVSGYVPTLLLALSVLVVGWIVAALVSAGTRHLLRRTTLDNRLAA